MSVRKQQLLSAAALAITFMLLFVARLATSYDQYPATSVHLDLDSPQDESIENPNAIFHEPEPPPAAPQVSSTSKTTTHDSDKIAVILESRPLPHLVPLLLHFSTVLGPDWPIQVFTSPTTKSKLLKTPSLKRLVTAGKLFSSYSGMSQEEFLLRHYHLLFDLQASAQRYVSGATTQNSSQRSNC
jgi:hypothetical protein